MSRHARHRRASRGLAQTVAVVTAALATLGAMTLAVRPEHSPAQHAAASRSVPHAGASTARSHARATTTVTDASTSTPPTTPAPTTTSAWPTRAPPPWATPAPAGLVAHLAAGSDPRVLPGPLLIADKLNNRLLVVDPQGRVRWQFPERGDLAPGQSFRVPDDAFFTPDGRYIVATQEDQAAVSVIDVATRHIVYRYGQPGRPGMGANQLDNPDDAMMLPNGDLVMADIKNCRLLVIGRGAHAPLRVIGQTTTACLHHPPARWGSPNGVFPLPNGRYLVTEINGNWVDEINLSGRVYWSAHPPGVGYPSDTNQYGPDAYLTADYSSPGQVETFDRAGRLLWRYRGSGAAALNHPSLALPLPNGDIVLNDDFDHRVVVIDTHTHRIVWQYGVTGIAGVAPGYLDNPDGVDLAPPYSLLVTHATTMGLPPVRR